MKRYREATLPSIEARCAAHGAKRRKTTESRHLFEHLFLDDSYIALLLLRFLTPCDVSVLSRVSSKCRRFYCGMSDARRLINRWWMGNCILWLTSYRLDSFFGLPWEDMATSQRRRFYRHCAAAPLPFSEHRMDEGLLKHSFGEYQGTWAECFSQIYHHRTLTPPDGDCAQTETLQLDTEVWETSSTNIPRSLVHLSIHRYRVWANVTQLRGPPPLSPTFPRRDLAFFAIYRRYSASKRSIVTLTNSQLMQAVTAFQHIAPTEHDQIRILQPKKLRLSLRTLQQRYLPLRHPYAFNTDPGHERTLLTLFCLLVFFHSPKIWHRVCSSPRGYRAKDVFAVSYACGRMLSVMIHETGGGDMNIVTAITCLVELWKSIFQRKNFQRHSSRTRRVLYQPVIVYPKMFQLLVQEFVPAVESFLQPQDNMSTARGWCEFDEYLINPLAQSPPFLTGHINVYTVDVLLSLLAWTFHSAAVHASRQLVFRHVLSDHPSLRTCATSSSSECHCVVRPYLEYQIQCSSPWEQKTAVLVLDNTSIYRFEYHGILG